MSTERRAPAAILARLGIFGSVGMRFRFSRRSSEAVNVQFIRDIT